MTQTHLEIRVHRGQRDAAISALRARRVFEECGTAASGFFGAELLVSPEDPDVLYIVANWRDCDAAKAWITSLVREAQNRDLSCFISEPPVSRLLLAGGYSLGPPENTRS